MSLTDKLSNLHLLLRSPYFSKWPLEVRFFCEDVYRVWQTWCDRVDARLPVHIKVWLEPKHGQAEESTASTGPTTKRRRVDLVGKGGVEGVDTTYASLQPVLEKGQFVLDQHEQLNCDVCHLNLALDRDLIVICPHGACRSISHVKCLSHRFLAQAQGEGDALVPTGGSCPSCCKELQWVTLMKELSLRVRAAKEVQKILKKRPGTRVDLSEDENEDEDEFGDEADALTAKDVADEDEDDNDVMSVTSADSELSSMTAASVLSAGKLDIIVEDSDDEIEMLKM